MDAGAAARLLEPGSHCPNSLVLRTICEKKILATISFPTYG